MLPCPATRSHTPPDVHRKGSPGSDGVAQSAGVRLSALGASCTLSLDVRTMPRSQQRRESMHDDFASLFTFNRWANAKMLEACRKLTPEQYIAEPMPGWSSVRATVY